MNSKVRVENLVISLLKQAGGDFISLTDMERFRDMGRTNYIIQNWLRTRNTLEFIGLWEILYNSGFIRIEIDVFLSQASANRLLPALL